ncbi:MAG: alpha/beta hydrolase family protein [Caulobacter sp.]
MKAIVRNICLAVAAAGILGSAAVGQTAAPAGPPPAEAFGREPNITSVSLSPDGKHLAAVVSPDGKTRVIAIWKTDAMDKPPSTLGCGERQDCWSVSFVKNDRIYFTVRQTVISGEYKGHLFRSFFSDLSGSKIMNMEGKFDQTNIVRGGMVSTMPYDDKNVVVSGGGALSKLNLYTGQMSKFYTQSDKFGQEQLDLKGEVRARVSVDYEGGKVYIAQWIRNPANGNWEEHWRNFAAERQTREIVGFSEDPNVIYVLTNEGRDKAGIFLYDIAAKKIIEPAFQHPMFEASGTIQSGGAKDYGRLLGFSFLAADGEQYWLDGKIDAIAKDLRKAFGIKTKMVSWTDVATGEKTRFRVPDGADINIADWSDDMTVFLLVKSGPSQPPEFYLMRNGQVVLLGKSRPYINPDVLGDTELVQYAARDGLMIPAFVTKPKASIWGPGPYPAIVLPHGGPWSRDSLSWDGSGWTQYFAARGYVVLQPQFRGSEGWGQKLWRAGDSEWGQKMQDDMDDGAKWMVEQKLTAPDRIAMHGYSFGGYSAMAAAVRNNGVYQCAVAGAGVAELESFRTGALFNRLQREYQRPTINGLDPLSVADRASIPVFLYHGDYDNTVPVEQSHRFRNALQKAGKPVKYLELPQMGHSYATWMPGQGGEVLTAVEGYLRTECGPGGL